eukprot:gene24148-31388_t
MCLVCIINAEEARLQKSNVFDEEIDSCKETDIESEEVRGDSIESGNYLSIINNDQALHYFAIGSMTNMTALSLRELSPISSRAAVLKGHRLIFRGHGGMATAEEFSVVDTLTYDVDEAEYPFDCVHGVLHLLTMEHVKLLDEFEGGYLRKQCIVSLYDGTEVNAFFYQMDRQKWASPKDSLPTERYLDIIAKGCAAHGVAADWIRFIEKHKSIARKCSTEFSSFTMTTENVPIISWDQIRDSDGRDDKKLWIVICNKVLEFNGDRNSFFPFGYFVKNGIGGTDFTVRFAKAFFEPKYKLSATTRSCCELEVEHRAWVEDQFANPPPVLSSSKWTMVGVIASDKHSSRQGLRRACGMSSQEGFDFLDLTEQINSGANQIFIREGQTLNIRKTSLSNFPGDVVIHIKNQDLSSPNVQSLVFIMTPSMYALSWCWDGSWWLLESVGQAVPPPTITTTTSIQLLSTSTSSSSSSGVNSDCASASSVSIAASLQ